MNPSDYYFQYTVDPSADEPIMLIDRHIGYDEEDGYGIMGDSFQRELLVLDSMGKKRIQVWINSPGGLVSDGYNIYNALLKTTTKVDTYCIGMAASIAGVIFQAGRKRIMNDYGILMYHNPFGGSNDKGLDAIKDSIVQMICSRSGMEAEACTKMMARTTFIDAQEAMTMGLCDEIDDSVEFNKKRALASTDDAKNFYNEIKNSLNNFIIKPVDMKKVANKLNLNSEASEDAIVSEVERIQNKLVAKEKELEEKEVAFKAEQVKAKADLDAEKAELTKVKNELAAIKTAATEKEAADKLVTEAKLELDAKNMIEGFVTAGKIKNEAAIIAEWTKAAKANLEGTKILIDGMGINKVANRLNDTVTDVDAKKLRSYAANKMIALNAAGK